MDKVEENTPLRNFLCQTATLLIVLFFFISAMIYSGSNSTQKKEEIIKTKELTIGEKTIIIDHSNVGDIDCKVDGNFISCYVLPETDK